MDFGLSEEQVLLKQSVRRFLDEQCPTTRVRTVMESDTGHDSQLWQGLVDLGIPGLMIPPEQGGSGLGLLDLALVAEELGYAATPGPFLGTVLATIALCESGDTKAAAHWLPRVAEGSTIGTIAFGEGDGQWDLTTHRTRIENGKISGEKPFVPYASLSDFMIVSGTGEEGPGLWIVERGAPGLEITPLRVVDLTRRVEGVRFRDTPATRLAGHPGAAQRTIDAGCVLLAADAYGGAVRCLEMTVSYARTREQFGQVIGAFQAVKHQIANMACKLEPALALWWYAAHAFDHIKEESTRHSALVKAHLSDLFDRITRDATELHGGIGFTWEFDLHLWFRRAVFDRSFLGDASFHRTRAADLAGW